MQPLTNLVKNLPRKLGRPPLLEATFELRFSSGTESLPDRVPGVLFSKLPDDFRDSEVLPLASLPREFRRQDPNLQYASLHRIIGDGATAYVGDRVIGLSRLAPYSGWSDFRPRIERFVEALEAAELGATIERYSLKGTNILPPMGERELDMLQLSITVAGVAPFDRGFNLRAEFNDDEYIRIVEVTPGSVATTRKQETFRGMRVAVDCIRNSTGNLTWDAVRGGLDPIHLECKRLFFSLLTSETLAALKPEYA